MERTVNFRFIRKKGVRENLYFTKWYLSIQNRDTNLKILFANVEKKKKISNLAQAELEKAIFAKEHTRGDTLMTSIKII